MRKLRENCSEEIQNVLYKCFFITEIKVESKRNINWCIVQELCFALFRVFGRSVGGEGEEDIGEGFTEVGVLLTGLVHLHLGQLELDVALVVSESANDLFLVEGSVSLELGLHLGNLSLGLVGAVSDVLVQTLEDGHNAIHAVHDVIVVAAIKRVNSRVDALLEAVVVRKAVRDLITVLLSSEGLDHAGDQTLELVRVAARHWVPLDRAIHRLILLGEEVLNEGDASSLVLTLFHLILEVSVSHPALAEQLLGRGLSEAVILLLPLLGVHNLAEVAPFVPGGGGDAAKSSHERTGGLTVFHLKDRGSLLPHDEIVAVPVGLEVGEALILVEGVSDGVPSDDLVVVGAVSEDFGEAVFVDLRNDQSLPGREQHLLHHFASFSYFISNK